MVLPVDARGRMSAVKRQIQSIAALGIDVDVLEVRGRRRLKYVESLPRLVRQAAAATLVHAHYGLCGLFARTNVRKPLVVSFMGSDLLGVATAEGTTTLGSRVVVKLDLLLARHADAVIVKSPEMATTVAPVRAHVIPNGVDLTTFRQIPRVEARRELGWDRRRRVLFPGCPDEARKGFPLASEIAAEASTLLGEPVDLVPLCRVDAELVPLYINACDAVLMTSFWEGSPNVVKEAMACDAPIVSVAVGDVMELLDGVSGCTVVASRDPSELANAVAAAATRGKSGGRAAIVEKGLDLESTARRVAAVYDGVVGGMGRC
jgi:glycosyltransferase involved in cell wall biosynthesis